MLILLSLVQLTSFFSPLALVLEDGLALELLLLLFRQWSLPLLEELLKREGGGGGGGGTLLLLLPGPVSYKALPLP